jgi:hypothetical protein
VIDARIEEGLVFLFTFLNFNPLVFIWLLNKDCRSGKSKESSITAGKGLLMSTKNDLNMFAFLNQLSIL